MGDLKVTAVSIKMPSEMVDEATLVVRKVSLIPIRFNDYTLCTCKPACGTHVIVLAWVGWWCGACMCLHVNVNILI
jgi:hypothetical protein